MKFKTYINNIIAVITLLALVGGFQISTENSDATSNNLTTVESMLGVNEANAGPCGAAGCDGADMYCTSVTVLHIGDWQMKKDCDGNPPEEEKGVQQE